MRNILTVVASFLSICAFAQSGIVGGSIPTVMITEIMYNPPESGNDTLEFVELFNTSGLTVNMAGVTFTSGITYSFPPDVSISGNGYLVIAGDSAKFVAFYGGSARQWTGGATQLNNSGEALVMKTANSEVVDSVFFDDAATWPQGANGQGFSLTLCSTGADNNLPSSWYPATTATGGTINAIPVFANPGSADPCLGVGMTDAKSVRFEAYPNPATDRVFLSIPSDIDVYDMTGQRKASHRMTRELNLTGFAPGLYIIRTSKGEMVRIVKK